MYAAIKMLPIIKPCAANGFIVEPEAERAHEIERHTERYGYSSYCAGVVRDFRA
jgi:hypothetical protein